MIYVIVITAKSHKISKLQEVIMKKILAVILSSLIICAAAGCGSNQKSESASKAETTQAATEAVPEATVATASPAVSSDLEDTIKSHDFEGIIYAVKDGKPVASYAKGKLENGSEITLDSPMPVGSVSKQFCAAAVLLLQEQGKLNVNDTLDKFYPDYKEGKKITLKNVLSMRSGIPEITEEAASVVTLENSEEQNVAAIKKWVFEKPLTFEPDKDFTYTNTNYFLLSDIVAQTSGKKYIDFLRENFFTKLGMTHTGSIGELDSNPKWTLGNTYKKVDLQKGLTNGCGDLISTAADITAWIEGLSSGKVISEESYKAMTTNYSDENNYGYGMFLNIEGGVGHYGNIGIYSSFDYINTDKKLTVTVFSNTIEPTSVQGLTSDLLTDLMG